ncbi:MAG TPA: hypothetical protein VHO69_09515, partial [Phototrophicaceae bacterium]|nr:hypothetical protein [Phototrophicaceae bacterium]
PNARFIQDINDARAQEIVLLPELATSPDLGGSYVGERFVITHTWNAQAVRWLDFPAWWSQRRVRLPATPLTVTILWLRQDIYNGVPFDPLQG